MFLRGIPNLHSLMRPILGAENRTLHSPDNEPNFYSLRPLPVTDLNNASSITTTSTYNRIPVNTPTPPDPVPDLINQLIMSKAVAAAAAAGRSFRGINDASGFSPLSANNFNTLKSATSAGLGTTPPFGSLTALDFLRMNNDLRAVQHLHKESIQHLTEAKIIADLQTSTISPSLTGPTATTAATTTTTTTSKPLGALSKDTPPAKQPPKKKRPRRKWLPPLGPPPPRPACSTIGVTGATSSSGGAVGVGALQDWYLTNPEVFASLSEGSNPLLPAAKK
jgi:hypothetical protein